MNNRFAKCASLAEAKTLYHTLAMELHPDRHPAEEAERWTEAFKLLNAEYAYFCSNFAKFEERNRQRQARDEGWTRKTEHMNLDDIAEWLRVKIEFALNLEGVEVELCGLWVWVTGDTYPHREALKANGFKFAPKKRAWFYDGVPSANFKSPLSLEQIRDLHGSVKFDKPEKEERAGIPAYASA